VSTLLVPVILSGGSGTRLWPLSVADRPKQFLPLVGVESLFQDTLRRLDALPGAAEPIVICNERHRFLVAEQLRELGRHAAAIALERVGRNTAPALAIAARLAQRAAPAGDAMLLVLPADHVIGDRAALAAAVAIAMAATREGRLVTFGIAPTRPETGYGYILQGAPAPAGWAELERFVEKPDAATAACYLESGRYLWNSGMFVFSARHYLDELARHAPDIAAACERAVAEAESDADFVRLGASFAACRADSIDYAVMEKTDSAAVVPLAAGWSDVGSWTALHELIDPDADGNVLRGDVLALACRNSYVRAESRQVAVLGLENCVVVETSDAVLVMSAERAQELKTLVERVERKKHTVS
jgi:mannose-1-phosphate guanylyltransferase/mannose-6-phosphate isomerase